MSVSKWNLWIPKLYSLTLAVTFRLFPHPHLNRDTLP